MTMPVEVIDATGTSISDARLDRGRSTVEPLDQRRRGAEPGSGAQYHGAEAGSEAWGPRLHSLRSSFGSTVLRSLGSSWS